MKDLIDTVTVNYPAFARGVWLTIELLALSSSIGIGLAVPIALIRLSRVRLPALLARTFIYVFRGTPLLTQLFLIYYGLAQFDTVRNSPLWPILRDPWPCALIALSLNMAAYVAEVLRGGIQSVPRGEREAGLAIGMGTAILYRRIILPKAFRIALPALSNEVVIQLKSTALISTITLMDLTGVARRIASNTYTTDALLVAGILYLVLTYAIGRGFRLIERRLNRHLA
jgi:His/Glu/Gln/Arg/opine family amino acid ABC transporter permease subunit